MDSTLSKTLLKTYHGVLQHATGGRECTWYDSMRCLDAERSQHQRSLNKRTYKIDISETRDFT
jgi:hypothetical protein